MSTLNFFIVDVFAESKYAGNQLAVFTDAGALSSGEMQKIARETNFSETTFITSVYREAHSYKVRIFTPEYEVPFAGHPTLGTAYIIRRELQEGQGEIIHLDLQVGDVPVTFVNTGKGSEILWMKQPEPVFGNILPVSAMAKVLGLNEEDFDGRFPIQEVSTGLPFIVVPLKGLEMLQRIVVSKEHYFALINTTEAKNIQVFCPQTHGGQDGISTRMFTDYLGIPEDPATGSGNGCLAAYFVRHRYFGEARVDTRSEQGYEMGRPSVLYLKALERNGSIEVNVGGNVVPVAKGEWSI